jgi:hypothetical protein
MSLRLLPAPPCRPRGPEGERGSVPLALLASIVAAGLVTVVVATVLAGERAVRFDEGFTSAIHVAEAGVQDALYELNSGGDISDGGSGTVDGKPYTWTAQTHGDHAWLVSSTGEGAHGVERTVEGLLADDPVFGVSAFADQAIEFAGSNIADSYHSVDDVWCTGNGRVGSNDDLEFNGDDTSNAPCSYDISGQTVDGVDLHDWADNPGWPDTADDRCVHDTGIPNNCKEDSETPAFEMHPERLEFTDELGWVDDVLGHDDCDPDTGSQWVDTWKTTERHEGMITTADGNEAGTVSPADSAYPRLWAGDSDSPRAYCVGTLWFDEHTAPKNAAPYDPDNPDGDGPVVFVVRDEAIFERGTGEKSVAVNCGGCHPGEDTWHPRATGWATNPVHPKAGSLHIYMAANSTVSSRQHSRIAAGVYTPNASCQASGGSAAGVHVFGALVCGTVTNQGGWQFHYDDAMRDQLRTGRYSTDRLNEE